MYCNFYEKHLSFDENAAFIRLQVHIDLGPREMEGHNVNWKEHPFATIGMGVGVNFLHYLKIK